MKFVYFLLLITEVFFIVLAFKPELAHKLAIKLGVKKDPVPF
jgi:hypothetical protein